jgi:hypothetical protein
MSYYQKYLKYKTKYLSLKNKMEGGLSNLNPEAKPFIPKSMQTSKFGLNPEANEYVPESNQLNSSITPTRNQQQFVKENSMVVNLMWLNSDTNDNTYVYPETHKDINLTEKINGWINNGFIVYLWIDKSKVTHSQIINTQQLFSQNSNFFIKIIDDMFLNGYDEIKSCKTYTRLDFIRLLILKKFAELEFKFKYYIYSDIVVNPLTQQQLINSPTLNEYKIALSNTTIKDKGANYENSFIAIKNDITINNNLIQFVEKMYEIIIKNKNIYESKEKPCCKFEKGEVEIFYNVIYVLIYIQFNTLFYPDRSNNIKNIFNDSKLINKITGVSNDTNFHKVPYDEEKIRIMFGQEDKKIVRHEYVYPVINIERPVSNRTYDEDTKC